MALYAIGDVQGCCATLERLLARIGFDPAADGLWLAGDLVNRGPRSLETLRLVRGLGRSALTVLGNHDLQLIGRALGLRGPKAGDTLEAVLAAPDRAELVDWLRRRPLLHRDGRRVLVHAGLLPEWTLPEAEALAREAEAVLAGPEPERAFDSLAREGPLAWSAALEDGDRLRLTLYALTRLRTCRSDGRVCPGFSGPPEQAPRGCLPWFDVPGRRSFEAVVVCGHWASLGLLLRPDLVALDSGCVWGRSLTAVRLDDGAVFQQPFADGR